MAEAPQDDVAQADVTRLREELKREHDRLLRALADFDNYRRRTDREQASAARKGKRDIVLPLLDVLDDFDRALRYADGAPPALGQGLAAVQRKLLELLAREGVTRLESQGERFDPRLHDAIGTTTDTPVPSGSIAEVLQHGYVWDEEVLRPARVRVAE